MHVLVIGDISVYYSRPVVEPVELVGRPLGKQLRRCRRQQMAIGALSVDVGPAEHQPIKDGTLLHRDVGVPAP
jgi:hypothetical protein